jgi:hypothetical protein
VPRPWLYLDSFIFREDSELTNDEIKTLWKDESVIIFVHSNYKYYVDFAAGYPDKKIHFISVYSANAASSFGRVINEAIKYSDIASANGQKACALISAGPAGKAMVVRMAEAGLRALDMGHYFDYKFYELRRERKPVS